MPHLTRRQLLKSGAALTLSTGMLSFSSAMQAADGYQDGVLVSGEPPKPQPGSFTIAVLPDTQHYSEQFPDTYLAQTKWIVANQQDRNIACVLHLGDITTLITTTRVTTGKPAARGNPGTRTATASPGLPATTCPTAKSCGPTW